MSVHFKRNRLSTAARAALLAAAAWGAAHATAQQQLPLPRTQLNSIDSGGVPANGNSIEVSVSPSGRHVAFSSNATNLAGSDANGTLPDILVRDRLAGTTTLVSVSSAGQQANMESRLPSIAGQAAHIAFQSRATNLVSPDTNGDWDIFVRSPVSGQTVMVSVDSSGNQGNGPSQAPFISGDEMNTANNGRFVVYRSHSTNLVPGDTNGQPDIFLHDRDTDGNGVFDEAGGISTSRVSVSTFNQQANAGSFPGPVTPDGRFVVFWSNATNLVNVDANAFVADVFIRDTLNGITQLVSYNSNGQQANDDWVPPPPGPAGPGAALDVTPNGRYVTYSSYATNLDTITPDTNGTMDVFVVDLLWANTVRVSVNTAGVEGNGPSYNPTISPDGRFVAFLSEATNFPVGPGLVNLYVHDRDTDNDAIFDEPGQTATMLVEGVSNTLPFLSAPQMSQVGSTVAYVSGLPLVGADTNGFLDTYVTDVRSDRDGDGLLDGWEWVGIDIFGEGVLDSPGFLTPRSASPVSGSDPLHRELYVEIDAMTGRVPTQTGLNLIAGAFLNAPVTNPDGTTGIDLRTQTGQLGVLLVDEGNLPLPADNNGDGAPDPWSWPNGACNTLSPEFCTAKTAFFGTTTERASPNWADIRLAKLLVYRYGIFADVLADAAGNPTTISGLAEMPGNDFMVTLGGWPTPGGTQGQQMGVFMHELGHALGLGHGGGDMINYKPNYHSVMNFTWTLLPPTPPANLCYFFSYALDYSGAAWPIMDETNLNEAVGIGGHPGHCVPVGPVPIVVAASGPADYNGDGQLQSGVAQDLNRVVSPAIDPSSGVGTQLIGYDDWSNLQYAFVGSNFGNDPGPPGDPIPEITFEIYEALGEAGIACPFDLDGDGLVGVTDLVVLLGAWGTDPGGPPDFDGDGTVGILDLVALLAAWGPCE